MGGRKSISTKFASAKHAIYYTLEYMRNSKNLNFIDHNPIYSTIGIIHHRCLLRYTIITVTIWKFEYSRIFVVQLFSDQDLSQRNKEEISFEKILQRGMGEKN